MRFSLSFSIFFINALLFNCSINPHEKSDNNTSQVSGYSTVKIDSTRIQLLGVLTEKVIFRELTKTIRTVGIVQVDETRIAHIQTKFGGWIEELYVDFVGMPVSLGQPLFKVYSPELLATQEEYLLALNDLKRPIEGRFARELKQASEELLQAAHHRLTLWDVPLDEIAKLKQTQLPTKTLVIRSTVNGIVVSRNAFVGMNVEPGLNTFTLADLSHVWVLADIYEDNISFIKLGQKVKLKVDSFPNEAFEGSITFIDYVLEASTRTIKIRFEFDNKDLRLKPGMYATVNIQLDMGIVLALPEDALIDTGKRKIVFIYKENGNFEPREVGLGFKAGGYYQILTGLTEQDLVVVKSQFLLDSESRLKALEAGGIGQKQHKLNKEDSGINQEQDKLNKEDSGINQEQDKLNKQE